MSETTYKHDLVGAMGMPISENPTGLMMEAAFKALNLNWRYELFEVAEDSLKDALTGMRALGFKGMNFTIPHKVKVLNHLDEVASDAAIIGAVNTVRIKDSKLIGENTDGKGFIRALTEAGVSATANHVVILGAGGAARAITVELALAGTKRLSIVNRNAERGQTLIDLLNAKTPAEAKLEPWQSTYSIPADCDILVNATSIGLYPDTTKPNINYESLSKKMLVCDVIPNPPDTAFLQEARQRGARTLDGLGMLVYQGAIAFKMWTGQDAPTEVMKQALEEAFA
jgi:shikimate dehydrogenase